MRLCGALSILYVNVIKQNILSLECGDFGIECYGIEEKISKLEGYLLLFATLLILNLLIFVVNSLLFNLLYDNTAFTYSFLLSNKLNKILQCINNFLSFQHIKFILKIVYYVRTPILIILY